MMYGSFFLPFLSKKTEYDSVGGCYVASLISVVVVVVVVESSSTARNVTLFVSSSNRFCNGQEIDEMRIEDPRCRSKKVT